MNLTEFLKQWEKTHPITEANPLTDKFDDKMLAWLKAEGESPLPLWPKLEKGDTE